MNPDATITPLSVDIPVEIESRDDGRYVASSRILPGCTAVGKNPQLALARFRVAVEDLVAKAIVDFPGWCPGMKFQTASDEFGPWNK